MAERELDPSEARARAVGNAVYLEHIGGSGDIASWGCESRERAEFVAGQINALLNGLRASLADSARVAGEYAHEMRTRVEWWQGVAEAKQEERDRLRAGLEILSQIRHVTGSAQNAFRSHLRTVDAVLAGADVRELETVEAIADGTWQPTVKQ